LIHAPSLAIGAIIASITITLVIFGVNNSSNEIELSIEPTPEMDQIGPKKITMDTFLSNCNVFFQSIEKDIVKNYVDTGKVKIIFKDYNIIGEDSVIASQGAHCANDQGLFWEYHDILYSNWTGENNGWASSENLAIFAQQIDLNMNKWSECMKKGSHSQIILKSNDDARTLELTGTPAFFIINSEGKVSKLFGAQPFEVFKKIFDSQLEN
jgi:protein-disulfide isomerase